MQQLFPYTPPGKQIAKKGDRTPLDQDVFLAGAQERYCLPLLDCERGLVRGENKTSFARFIRVTILPIVTLWEPRRVGEEDDHVLRELWCVQSRWKQVL